MIKSDVKSKNLSLKAVADGLRKNKMVLFMVIALAVFLLFYQEFTLVAVIYQSDLLSISCWLCSMLLSNFDFAFQLNEVRVIVDGDVFYLPFSNNQTYIVGIYILFLSSIRICKNIYKKRFWKYMITGVVLFSGVRVVTYTLAITILQQAQCDGSHLGNAINTLTHLIDYCILYPIGKMYIKKLKFISNKSYPYFIN